MHTGPVDHSQQQDDRYGRYSKCQLNLAGALDFLRDATAIVTYLPDPQVALPRTALDHDAFRTRFCGI